MKPLQALREEKHLKEQYGALTDMFVGPIPVEEFLEELLPAENLKDPSHVNFGKVAQARTSEAACRALMQAGGQLCPSFKFTHTSSRVNDDVAQGLRPSVACYRKHTSRIREPADDWQAMEMFVVIAEKDDVDSWSGDPNSETALQDPSWKSRARVITYARSQFCHQMRIFAFSLGIYGHCARLFLWDRSGVLVTEAFDYVLRPKLLAQFLQRFNGLSAEERGWDATAQPTTYAEAMLLTDAIKTYLENVKVHKVPMLPNIHETLDKRYSSYKIRLTQPHCGETCEVIVRRPFVMPAPLVGRSTHGYIGYHLGEKRLVFLKDYWANDSPKKKLMEVDAYRHLLLHDIPHIPNVLYAGYVRAIEGADQRTPSTSYGSRGPYVWVRRGKLKSRLHVRVVQDIAYPLAYVHNSKQLVLAIRNALTAIQEAASKAKLMHCDISSHNIMLSANGHGILNDWDNARFTNSSFYTPVGTWFFASILTVPGAKRRHTVKDDVEACFWTLLFQSTRLFEYDQLSNSPNIHSTLSDQSATLKKNFLLEQTIEAPHFESAPLNEVIARLRKMLADHHMGITTMKDSSDAISFIDDALRRPDWPEADAHHNMPARKLPSPFDVRDYVSSWSLAELKTLDKPEYFEAEATRLGETARLFVSAPAIVQMPSTTEVASLEDAEPLSSVACSHPANPRGRSINALDGLDQAEAVPNKRRRLR